MNREECDCCIKHKTMYCPNSSECYSLGNLPNFKTKLDILKENDTLNKGIDELIKKYNKKYDPKEFYLDVENTMICEFIKELKKLKGE